MASHRFTRVSWGYKDKCSESSHTKLPSEALLAPYLTWRRCFNTLGKINLVFHFLHRRGSDGENTQDFNWLSSFNNLTDFEKKPYDLIFQS